MRIFDFDDYKDFVRARVQAMPKRGHGQYLRIAKLLGVHTTMVTHIFKGDSHLSSEQALRLAEDFGLTELETDYLVELVHLARAGNVQSRAHYRKKLEALRTRALNLRERLHGKQVLDEKDQAIFYSSWVYSGIRLLTAVHELSSPEAIAEKTGLSVKAIAPVLEFLLGKGLLKEENGRYAVGETITYVSRDARASAQHHRNWRLKSVEQLTEVPEDELVFTNPITVSRKDFLKIREEIVQLIERFQNIADPSPPEELCYLNIDWRRAER